MLTILSRVSRLRYLFIHAPFLEFLAIGALTLLCCASVKLLSRPPVPQSDPPPTREVWILYYGGWGNLDTDGEWGAWHQKGAHNEKSAFEPPDYIPSPHYPLLGPYSCHSEAILRQHLSMIRNASIDAIVFPWDGPWLANGTLSSFTDKTLKLLFKLAPAYSLKIIPLFPFFEGRNKTTMVVDLTYYKGQYLTESAHYRVNGRPLAIIYNSQELRTCAELLDENQDMAFMASALTANDFFAIYEEGFLGFLTFFASDQLSWASDAANWKDLSENARRRKMEFIPAVSPGYNNTPTANWDRKGIKSRGCAAYYDERWSAAIYSQAHTVMINSFNGWHEGSVIEPVVNRVNYTLSDDLWCSDDPEFFIKRTVDWISLFRGMPGNETRE
jgi:hypothetical protein